MKNILMIVVLLIATLFAKAQCKLKTDKIDEFKKINIRETHSQNIAKNPLASWLFSFKQVNTTLLLEYEFYIHGQHKIIVIGEGESELNLKCINDSVITLTNFILASGEMEGMGNRKSTKLHISYQISPEQIKYLIQNPPIKMRFTCKDYAEELEIHQGRWKKLEPDVNCLLSLYENQFKK